VTVAELGFWHALALWNIAIIAEGILRKAQQDPLNLCRVRDSGSPDECVRLARRRWEAVRFPRDVEPARRDHSRFLPHHRGVVFSAT
jgi:hypothetical protein